MRIFFVTVEFIDYDKLQVIDGGLANYLYKITLFLSKMGHDVNVLVLSTVDKKINFNGINVEFLNLTAKFKKTFWEKLVWCFLKGKQRRKIKNTYLKKYILHNYLETENKIKKIDIIQYASCSSTGQFPLENIPSCLRISSWAKVQQKCYGVYNQEEIDNETEQIYNSRFIFGPSAHIAEILKRDLKLKKDIQIIESPYGEEKLELDSSIADEINIKTCGKPYLLFFGSIGKLKGCKEIADCIYDVFEKFPDLYFVLVGKNLITEETNYLEMIKNNAKEHSNRVLHYFAQPHNILYPIIANSYAVILPSRTENFANTCVEAMRSKKIVVGTEDNFSQLITDGENGFLAKIANSSSLFEKITEVMNLDSSKKLQMEEAAFKTTERLSPEIITDKLLKYYQFVIENWNKKESK